MCAERSLFWTDATGDGGPYNQTLLAEWMEHLFSGDQAAAEGVLKTILNELEVTGAATPVAVNTGSGMVKGHFYHNSASVNVAVATPAGSTRVDLIVLEADWTAQTVRIANHAGIEGAGAPVLTQVDGTTWEVPLAQASITTGGVITVTDTRVWCHYASGVSAEMLDTAIAGDGLAGGGGTALSVNVDDSTIEIDTDTLRVKDLGITFAKLNTDSVGGAKIIASTITTAKINNAAVTADKIAAAVAGDGLAGGAGSALSVNVDDATIEIAADTLQVKDGGLDKDQIANRTRTYFTPIQSGQNDTDVTKITVGSLGVVFPPSKTCTCSAFSQVPADYVSGLAARIIFFGSDTGVMRVHRRFYRGAFGAAFDNSDSGDVVTDYDVLVAFEYDTEITSSGGVPVAGDFVNVTFQREGAHANDVNAGFMYVVGLEMSYTADS